MRIMFRSYWLVFALLAWSGAHADAQTQSKLTAISKQVKEWAADAAIVNAVKEQNAHKSAEHTAMTQESWSALTGVESVVRKFTQNPAADFLKSKRSEAVAEAFLSCADGTKVAFLAKPTNWSHKGKPKHEVPMNGRSWQGQPEVDASTGFEQIQISVPVLDDNKPIGSLVVGLVVAKLKE